MAEKRNRRISTLGSRITSFVSVGLVLILAGMAVMTGIAGKALSDEVRRNLGFIVKMERNCGDTEVSQLKRNLMGNKGVERLSFMSAEDILAEESQYIGDDVAALLDSNPYAAEFDVRVRPAYASADSISVMTAYYSDFPGVYEIVTESTVIEDVDASLRRAGSVLGIAALLLLVICVALINNTVSLSIYSRRFVIHTMKLVGATGSFIRRPFLNAAAVNGLVAGLVASGVLIGIRFYISSLDPMLAGALPDGAMALVCVSVVAVGVAICLLTASFATNRYLRASYDDMFLK